MDESKRESDIAQVSSAVDAQYRWSVLASAWELAAFSFGYPAQKLVEAIISGEWTEAAQEIADALGLNLFENHGKRIADNEAFQDEGASEDAEKFLHMLRAEATRLFVGMPKPICSPYEGIWRAEDEGVQALLFVNPHSMDVERFMKACGLGRPEGTNEPLDHVSTECELLEHLALRTSGTVSCESMPAEADLPEGSSEAAYRFFLDNHACIWMSRFAEKVLCETQLSFYRDAAAFLKALVVS